MVKLVEVRRQAVNVLEWHCLSCDHRWLPIAAPR